jgi:hypothetical protein
MVVLLLEFGLTDGTGDVIVWDNCLRFSARNFIHIKTRITQIVLASGLPTTGKKQELGNLV